MDSLAQIGTDTGNNRMRIRSMFFTYWKDKGTLAQKLEFVSWFKEGKKYAVQEEICPETKKAHLQGYVSFSNARCLLATRKRFTGLAHIEKVRSAWASEEYCKKVNTRLEGGELYLKGVRAPVRDPMAGLTYRGWQMEIATILGTEAEGRNIFWYWEPLGGVGKSCFVKHLCLTMEGVLMMSGKAADMKYGIVKHLEKGLEFNTLLIDLPRSRENKVSYEGIEEIKNGCFYSTKFESGQVVMNFPHIVIFSNFEPKPDKMSKDRFIVRLIEPIE